MDKNSTAEKMVILFLCNILNLAGWLVGAYALFYAAAMFFPAIGLTLLQALVAYLVFRRLLTLDYSSAKLLDMANESDEDKLQSSVWLALIQVVVPAVALLQLWILHFFI